MALAKDGSGIGAALTALQAKKAMESRMMGTTVLPGKKEPTGQTGSA